MSSLEVLESMEETGGVPKVPFVLPSQGAAHLPALALALEAPGGAGGRGAVAWGQGVDCVCLEADERVTGGRGGQWRLRAACGRRLSERVEGAPRGAFTPLPQDFELAFLLTIYSDTPLEGGVSSV